MIHSESLADQDRAHKLYKGVVSDLSAVLRSDGGDPSATGEDTKGDRGTLRRQPTEARKLCTLHMEVQSDNRVQIVRFGKFAHRDEALGRVTTPEKEDFLRDGKRFG
ncbi:hypothetical protein ASPCAL03263 [Aspergillus calidoustus]|uniref:Uncharacterized protein n=1 Tax=Aspergillus calidoustus TaxID=454130 RepID=A0A0U5GQV5_ASPCI|nr:hypothetical protein ASPCAL03263 [Aspergillus calidoustus]